jgi:hypothetical protein
MLDEIRSQNKIKHFESLIAFLNTYVDLDLYFIKYTRRFNRDRITVEVWTNVDRFNTDDAVRSELVYEYCWTPETNTHVSIPKSICVATHKVC